MIENSLWANNVLNSQEKQLQTAYVLQTSGIWMSYIILFLGQVVGGRQMSTLAVIRLVDSFMPVFIGGQMSEGAYVRTPQNSTDSSTVVKILGFFTNLNAWQNYTKY